MAQRSIVDYDFTELLVVVCLIFGVCLSAGLAVALNDPLLGVAAGTVVGLVLAGSVIAGDEFA